MKKNTFNSLLLAFSIAALTAVLPVSGQVPAPANPVSADVPDETEPPVGENGINPLSDLKEQKSE